MRFGEGGSRVLKGMIRKSSSTIEVLGMLGCGSKLTEPKRKKSGKRESGQWSWVCRKVEGRKVGDGDAALLVAAGAA